MLWIQVFLIVFCMCAQLACVCVALVALYHSICAHHVTLNEQARGYLCVASWRQCDICHTYERSSNTYCARHANSGTLVSLDPQRTLRVQVMLARYHEHYAVKGMTAQYHKDAIGRYLLWLEDVSGRTDWCEAVWMASEQHMDTKGQVEAFLGFVVAYEASIQQCVTLHGALKLYTQRDAIPAR